MHPDSARELKARVLERLPSAPVEASDLEADAPWPWVAVGLAPAGAAGARVAVRLQRDGDRALLPDLGRSARDQVDVRVISRVRALGSPTRGDLQRRARPLRPGLSVAHPAVSAGTLGGFVSTPDGTAILSNNHVLAASDAATDGDAVLQPGPTDGGGAADRVATLTVFERFREDVPNLIDAAVAPAGRRCGRRAGRVPGRPADRVSAGPLGHRPGRHRGEGGPDDRHTRGVVTAVEVDAVGVQYDALSSPQGIHRLDDQVEIQGLTGAFSAGLDPRVQPSPAPHRDRQAPPDHPLEQPRWAVQLAPGPARVPLRLHTGHHGGMTDRAVARAAKSALTARLSDDPGVVGVGLARRDGGYVLTVNLVDPAAAPRVPGVVDGVRVVTAVIGVVRPL